MTEDELIVQLREALSSDDSRIGVGIGDDAAVLASGSVISVDAMVEGVHFRRPWLSHDELGARATLCALSDLAAMGASAIAIVTSLVSDDAGPCLEIMRGASSAAQAHGALVVGGNLSRGDALSIHTTVIGHARRPWTRSGAQIGDAVYVTGPVGSSAVGWRALEHSVDAPHFIERWRRPTPRFDVVPLIQPTACIDVSDGLARDLERICEASEVGADISLDALPVDPGLHHAAARVGEEGQHLALTGGEDYELVFTAPASLDPSVATRIGEIVSPKGVRWHGSKGVWTGDEAGHRHF